MRNQLEHRSLRQFWELVRKRGRERKEERLDLGRRAHYRAAAVEGRSEADVPQIASIDHPFSTSICSHWRGWSLLARRCPADPDGHLLASDFFCIIHGVITSEFFFLCGTRIACPHPDSLTAMPLRSFRRDQSISAQVLDQLLFSIVSPSSSAWPAGPYDCPPRLLRFLPGIFNDICLRLRCS